MTGAILIGLGFSPLAASGLSLIANTAPVAYGALGTPITGLASGAPASIRYLLGAMVGRQLPFFSLIVPFWLIWAFAGFRGMMEIWPAILVSGVSFAVPQFLISNFINPWIVDIGASLISMACLIGFLKVWQPTEIWTVAGAAHAATTRPATMPPPHAAPSTQPTTRPRCGASLHAVDHRLRRPADLGHAAGSRRWSTRSSPGTTRFAGLHNLISKVPPVVAKPTPEGAVFAFTWLSYTGTGMLIAAIISGFLMGFSPGAAGHGLRPRRSGCVRYSLITIAAMLAIGTLTRYSGIDATLGLAFAGTGVLYPFFGTLLGWLGVALTGSDTASNVLFGSLQKITAEQLGLSPDPDGARPTPRAASWAR